MPDYAHSPITRLAARLLGGLVAAGQFTNSFSFSHSRSAQRFLDRDVYGVELMVPGHFFSNSPTAEVLEDDEVADEIEKAALIEDALDDNLEFRKVGVGESFAADRAPGLKPFPTRRKRADLRLNSVGDE